MQKSAPQPSGAVKFENPYPFFFINYFKIALKLRLDPLGKFFTHIGSICPDLFHRVHQ